MEDLLSIEDMVAIDIAYCACSFWGIIQHEGISNEGTLNYNPLVLNSLPIPTEDLIHLYPSHRCLGQTKQGHRCKRGAIHGKNRCNIHIKSSEWLWLADELGIPIE